MGQKSLLSCKRRWGLVLAVFRPSQFSWHLAQQLVHHRKRTDEVGDPSTGFLSKGLEGGTQRSGKCQVDLKKAVPEPLTDLCLSCTHVAPTPHSRDL